MAANGYLTTHILDTARGLPAANVRIDLYHLDGDDRRLLISTASNADGRTDAPLLKQGEMPVGTYELVFHMGDTFRDLVPAGTQLFVDVVPIRFGIDDADAHYHVPLLASPFSFSTYRGS